MSAMKILLIEDELYLRELYEIVLKKAGFTVLSASDGKAGLQLVKDNVDAALLMLDIMLPKMQGLDVLKALRANAATRKLPVVILSNLTEEHVIQEAMQNGAQSYLVKAQMTPQDIVDKVHEFAS